MNKTINGFKFLWLLPLACFFSGPGEAGVSISSLNPSSTDQRDCGQKCPQKNYTSSDVAVIPDAYFEMGTQTGGDFYFWAPGEFSSKEAIEAVSRWAVHAVTNNQPLLYKFGELQEHKKQQYSFEIDETVSEVFFLIGIQSKDKITIYKPNGDPVAVSEENGKVYKFTHMLMANIKKPVPGKWNVKIAGKGKYLISVRP